MEHARILFIGDIVGKPGRTMLQEHLPALRRSGKPDLVIANGENAAAGIGITPVLAEELFGLGVDVITLGNHAWGKREIFGYIDGEPRLIRPLNHPGHPPGAGSVVVSAGGAKVAVLNAIGRVFAAAHYDCPFRAVDAELERLAGKADAVIVDFHAEATSEKAALAWHLAGRVAAVIGTHTHVQTADATILPGGTAFLTDAGMTGPIRSVIGVRPELALERFLTQLPVRFEVASGPRQLNGVWVDVDVRTGRATGIEPVSVREPVEG